MAISFSTIRKTANKLGNLTASTTRSGSLSPQDSSDAYAFKLKNRSSVSLNFGNLQANTKLKLWSKTGSLLASATNGRSRSGALTQTLDPGTYYIQASTVRGKTRYRLQASAQQTIDSPLTAFNLGTPLTPVVKQGSVDWLDSDSDYYRFTLDRLSQYSVTISGTGAAVQLFQSALNGTSMTAPDETPVSPFFNPLSGSYSDWLPKGTYFIKVSNNSESLSATPYTLSVWVAPTTNTTIYLDLAPGSNASPTSAYNIGILNGSYTAEQYVGQFSPVNYYKFQINSTSDLNATIDNYSMSNGSYNPVSMQLSYDANGNGAIDTNELGDIYRSNGAPSLTISQAAQKPGTYFLEIAPEFSDIPGEYPGRYDLTLSAKPPIP